MTAADSEAEKKYFLCWSIINIPQPNLFKGDTYPGYTCLGCKGISWIKVFRGI